MGLSKLILKNKTLYGALIIIILWYILHFAIASSIVPSPHETIINFIKILPDPLLFHLAASLGRILAAVAVSLVIGVAIGLWIGMNERADKFFSPVLYILYPLPKIALLPIFMILFGLGNTSKIILIIVILVFQIVVTTRGGVKELTKELFLSARSLGMNRVQLYRHLVIPAVLPKIITALRISIGTSIAVLFFSENYAATYGIGYFIMNRWSMVNYVEMFSGILGLSVLGFGLFKLIDFAEEKLCIWIKIK
ncbi:MAG: ABC transporter permease [Mahellales bacterium]|jgi:NitT/TauT family transport system permease protein